MNKLFACLVAVAIAAAAFLVPAYSDISPPTVASTQSAPRRELVEMPWTDITPLTNYGAPWVQPAPIEIGELHLARPGLVLASLEFRLTALIENKYVEPIDTYVIGSGFYYRVGDWGAQVCTNMCGAVAGNHSLAASDGINYDPPSPLPECLVGFTPDSDHHLYPNELALPMNVGFMAAGTHSVTVASYTAMQDWNGVAVDHESHLWRYDKPRWQARVRFIVQR